MEGASCCNWDWRRKIEDNKKWRVDKRYARECNEKWKIQTILRPSAYSKGFNISLEEGIRKYSHCNE